MRLAVLASGRKAVTGVMRVEEARTLLSDRQANGEAFADETVVRLPRRHPCNTSWPSILDLFDLRGYSSKPWWT